MKKIICIAVVLSIGLALAPGTAPAQEAATQPVATAAIPLISPDQQPTKEQLAKLFEVMRVRQQMASMTKIMPALMQQQMAAQIKQIRNEHPEITALTEEQQQAIEKAMGKLMERSMNLYTPDEMIADMSVLYQKHLSRSDVDGTIAFYSSPAGQHMLEAAPVIMKEYMPMVMQRVQESSKPLIDDFAKEMEAICKSKTPTADKPAAN